MFNKSQTNPEKRKKWLGGLRRSKEKPETVGKLEASSSIEKPLIVFKVLPAYNMVIATNGDITDSFYIDRKFLDLGGKLRVGDEVYISGMGVGSTKCVMPQNLKEKLDQTMNETKHLNQPFAKVIKGPEAFSDTNTHQAYGS
ncbi:MAG: hypothetical protein AAFN93_26785 [Bacteroidota bacterium]